MEEVKGRLQDNTAIITLTGRIDSSNAAQVEEEIFKLLSDGEVGSLCIDMQGLEFISSSGLRILLKLRKIYGDYRLTDVGPEIYEVLKTGKVSIKRDKNKSTITMITCKGSDKQLVVIGYLV